jgi:hypothetical protein
MARTPYSLNGPDPNLLGHRALRTPSYFNKMT